MKEVSASRYDGRFNKTVMGEEIEDNEEELRVEVEVEVEVEAEVEVEVEIEERK